MSHSIVQISKPNVRHSAAMETKQQQQQRLIGHSMCFFSAWTRRRRKGRTWQP